MTGGGEGTRWRDWLLWWRVAPAELRAQLGGDARRRGRATARGLGAALAVLAAAKAVLMAGYVAAAGAPHDPLVLAARAAALVYLGLGVALARGRAAAAVGLMAWWTLDVAATLWLGRGAAGSPAAALVALLAAAFGWAVGMHVFAVAFRVARERGRGA